MEKIDFVNATHPAINDTNLNLMQDNIETAINAQVSGDTLPVGAIIPYTKTTAPVNWLICNGSAVSRTTYSQLFNIIGTQYGEGDGSTTFNLPDLRGKHPMGYDSTQTEFNALGKTGGEKTHTLTINEMPSHSHQADYSQSGGVNIGVTAMGSKMGTSTVLKSTGGDQAFNVLDPYTTTTYIIKAFQTAGVVAQVVNQHSESTTNVYSCNYFEPVDISSLITKTTKVGTITSMKAYKKGTRCYLSAQFAMSGEGILFTLDSSITPKYTEFGSGTNYQSGTSQPMIIKTTANSANISASVYASDIKTNAIIHLEWEV